MNTLAQGSAAFIVYCLAFLEKIPLLECNLNDEWQSCLKGSYCLLEEDLRRVNWKSPYSIPNLVTQLELICQPEYMVGLIGAFFLMGIVVGSVTLTRLGDIYGRKPTYMAGLWMHLTVTISFLFIINVYMLYSLLFLFGLSVTAKLDVGYQYLKEI